ncbi:MAG: hypothetical protein K6F34_10800 [Lachnospiraceae bacterium]|nr:hypothetical protein [Lachnospiraceae bacterium]
MKYTLTKRDIGILLGFFGIVILGLVYYFIYRGFSGKTTELEAANAAMQSRVDVLQDLVNRQDELVANTGKNNQKAEELMSKFPADYRYEDAILYGIDVEEAAPLASMPVIAFGEEEDIYTFENITAKADEQVRGYIPEGVVTAPPAEGEAPAEGEEAVAAAEPGQGLPVLKRKVISYTNTTDYPGLKNFLAHVIARADRSGLDVTAAYDVETGLIANTVQVKSYYVVNTDKIYEEPEMPIVVKGTDDLFDSVSMGLSPSDRLNMGSSGIVREETEENNE